ncbi:TetR family transcriptional regulator [Aquibacillus halophilus]|uniref:TetR family transcriptional regulator n=1 Tax=Aquibacillus halophilus TaxID=930132 RepID=UPI00196B1F84
MLRSNRKKELKEQIFLKAIELFKQKGYENVSVEEITSACGIAKGTFFNHFKKKEHILLQLGNSQLELLETTVHQHSQKKLKERLQLIFADLLSIYVEYSVLLKTAISETIRSAIVMKDESNNIVKLQSQIEKIIVEALEEKSFVSDRDPRVIASILVAIYFQSLVSWASTDMTVNDITRYFQEQFEVVWEGIENGEK